MSKEKKDKKEKKEKKDKKSKKEKKSKKSKSKKEKKNHRQEEKEAQTLVDPEVSSAVGRVLAHSIVTHGRILEDLPAMTASLDGNQVVNIDAISDVGLKKSLADLFKLLPLDYRAGHGWSKKKDAATSSISGFILQSLLESGRIKQPRSLTTSQSNAVRAVSKLFSGGSKANDAPLLRDAAVRKMKAYAVRVLGHIESTRVSNLAEIDDEDMACDLERIVGQLGLERIVDKEGNTEFSVPSAVASSAQVLRSVRYILEALAATEQDGKNSTRSLAKTKHTLADADIDTASGNSTLFTETNPKPTLGSLPALPLPRGSHSSSSHSKQCVGSGQAASHDEEEGLGCCTCFLLLLLLVELTGF